MTPIKSIRIKWFRGIREANISGLDQFTILVGRNGSGKSSVLEALYLVSAWIQPQDPVRKIRKLDYIVNRRGDRGTWRNSRNVLWYSMDTEKDVEIAISIDGQETGFILKYNPINNLHLWLGISGVLKNSIHRKLNLKEPELLALSDSSALIIDRVQGMIHEDTRRVRTLLQQIFPKLLEVLEVTFLVDERLLMQPSLIEKYAWPKILSKRLDKEIVEMLREEFEVDAEGLTYAPIGNYYALMAQLRRTSIRVDDLGDGARLAVLALMAILASRPKLLLIEEPETKMHPGGLRAFSEAILRGAKKMGAQVIVTTHSIEMLRIGLKISKKLGLNLSIIHLERDNEGLVNARKLSMPDAELLMDLGVDPRFLDLF